MAGRKPETFPPVTMAHIGSHGCRDLLVYCGSGRCHHSAALNGDRPRGEWRNMWRGVAWLARANIPLR
jgi:hypothetical protein